MPTPDEILAQFQPQAMDVKEGLGWTPRGFNELNSGLQEKAFNKAADVLGSQRGKDANETAGNIISDYTEPLGHSTAADVLRSGLQTGASLGLNPANFVAPGGGEKMLAGTVEDQAMKQGVKDIVGATLETKNMNLIDQALEASRNNMRQSAQNLEMIPGATPQALPYVKADQIPVNMRALKQVSGANVYANPVIKPANPTGFTIAHQPTTAESLLKKAQIGGPVSTAPGVSTRGYTLEQLQDLLARYGK